MKKILYPMLSVALVLSILGMALPLAAADELKPVVTISFAGYSELKADVEDLGKVAGQPGLAQMMEGMLAMADAGQRPGRARSIAALRPVALSDGSEDITAYGFLPITDLSPWMALMKNPAGEGPKLEDGIYEIPVSGETLYVTQKDKWTYVAQKKETFASVSNDPASLLGDMPKKYLLAVRASAKNVPDSLKQKGMAFLPMLAQASSQPPEMMQQNIEQIEKLCKELDEVMIGLTLDRQTNSSYLDLELTAQPDTNLASQLAATKPGKTDFAGLKISDAAATFNYTVNLTDDDVARAKKSLDIAHASAQEGLKDQDLSKEQLDLAEDVLNQLFDLAAKTIELKKVDYGMALVLEPNALTLAAGMAVADGRNSKTSSKNCWPRPRKTSRKPQNSLNSTPKLTKASALTSFPCPPPIPDWPPWWAIRSTLSWALATKTCLSPPVATPRKPSKTSSTNRKPRPAKKSHPGNSCFRA